MEIILLGQKGIKHWIIFINNRISWEIFTNGYHSVYHFSRKPTMITSYSTELNQKQAHPRVLHSPSLLRDTQGKVILVARPLLAPVAQKLRTCCLVMYFEHVCRFSNTTLHRNHLLPLVKHAAVSILTREYRIRKLHRLVTSLRLDACLRGSAGHCQRL